jgi:hypothetical protein
MKCVVKKTISGWKMMIDCGSHSSERVHACDDMTLSRYDGHRTGEGAMRPFHMVREFGIIEQASSWLDFYSSQLV